MQTQTRFGALKVHVKQKSTKRSRKRHSYVWGGAGWRAVGGGGGRWMRRDGTGWGGMRRDEAVRCGAVRYGSTLGTWQSQRPQTKLKGAVTARTAQDGKEVSL